MSAKGGDKGREGAWECGGKHAEERHQVTGNVGLTQVQEPAEAPRLVQGRAGTQARQPCVTQHSTPGLSLMSPSDTSDPRTANGRDLQVWDTPPGSNDSRQKLP